MTKDTSKKGTASAADQQALAVVPVEDGGFLALVDEDGAEMLKEAAPTPSDLNKLVTPSGSSGAFFTIETLEGEKPVKELIVVFAWESPVERSFYATGIDEGGDGPPHCSSADGSTGYGTRDVEAIQGGAPIEDLPHSEQDCKTCPFAQYGSALGGGNGQACKQRVRVVVFDQESLLPMVLQIPAASLKEFRRYKMLLLGNRLRASQVATRISLLKVSGSPDYYKMQFDFQRKLTEGEGQRLAGLAKVLADSASAS